MNRINYELFGTNRRAKRVLHLAATGVVIGRNDRYSPAIATAKKERSRRHIDDDHVPGGRRWLLPAENASSLLFAFAARHFSRPHDADT